MSAKRHTAANRQPPTVRVTLSRVELEDLIRLARQYEKSMGFSRYFVRLASGPEMRARFRFIAQESKVLEAFAQAQLQAADASDIDAHDVEFLPRALIAFWGRALSSLRSERSRRHMGHERLATRRALEDRLRAAFSELRQRYPELAQTEIATRREREVAWIRESLDS